MDNRAGKGGKPLMALLSAIVRSAGPRTPSGGRPRCVEQVMFRDGDIRYPGLQVDIRQSGLPEQKVQVSLPESTVVYNLRQGKRIADGKTSTWTPTLLRGRVRVFSLLPHGEPHVYLQVEKRLKAGRDLDVKNPFPPFIHRYERPPEAIMPSNTCSAARCCQNSSPTCSELSPKTYAATCPTTIPQSGPRRSGASVCPPVTAGQKSPASWTKLHSGRCGKRFHFVNEASGVTG